MLVRCCVEYDIRPVNPEHIFEAFGISYRADLDNNSKTRKFALHFQKEHIRIILIYIKYDQLPRQEYRDLPAKFRTDRSAAARHEHAVPCNIFLNARSIDLDLRSRKQIRHLNIAQLRHLRMINNLMHARHCLDRAFRL